MAGKTPYSGKLAIITGGASGLGSEMAQQLASLGARPILLDIAAPETDTFEYHQTDVRDAPALTKTITSIEAKHGPIDLAIASAAIDITGPAEQFTAEDWRTIIETNLIGCTNLVSALYPAMMECKSGQILFIASGAGLIGFPLGTPYTTTKAGLIGMASALRAEGKRHNVRVNVACPPIIDTPLTRDGKAKPGIDRPAFLRSLQKTPMPVTAAASRILKGAARNKPLIIFPARLALGYRLATLFPSLGEAIRADILRRFERLDKR